MDYTKLFHDKTAFERECLQQRMELYGFKNMARMELFLWDLELFLQIQKRFVEHIPKNPKTNLPMHTYFVDVPSVLSYKERNAAEGTVDKQELKIEFIMDTEDWEYTRKTGENIFAVKSSFEYQLLPVGHCGCILFNVDEMK